MLKTPHFKQSKDGLCLPACARMVLAYWGYTVSEAGVAKILGTKPFGTPISNIKQLRQIGYQVDLASLTLAQLKAYINNGHPVITQVWTTMLDYWGWETGSSHIVVVIGFDETFVYLNDPAFVEAPRRILWDGFLAAWAEFDEMAVLIYPASRN